MRLEKSRITLGALIILSIAIFPWWFTAILIIAGIFIFNNFYESFLFAVMIDSIYSIPRELFFNASFTSLLVVAILFFSIRGFKKSLRI